MGTRINVLFAHRLDDWSNRDETLNVLSKTLPVAQRLAAYWADGAVDDSPESQRWVAQPAFPPPHTRDYHRYSGPGPLFVEVNPFAVHVRTGGRWRGFLSIQQLRSAHLQAFRAIARAFAATVLRCFPDNDFVNDAFWDGGDFHACTAILDDRFGEPVPLEEQVDPCVAVETDIGVPSQQYVYTLQTSANPTD